MPPLASLQVIDASFLQYTVSKTLERSASVHLLFSFEYVIQVSIVVSAFIKYMLGVIDGYFEGRWESKVCRNTFIGSQSREPPPKSDTWSIFSCGRNSVL